MFVMETDGIQDFALPYIPVFHQLSAMQVVCKVELCLLVMLGTCFFFFSLKIEMNVYCPLLSISLFVILMPNSGFFFFFFFLTVYFKVNKLK